MTALLPHLVNGLALGLLFALIALGFMLVVSLMETINLAHGSFFALGMYVALRDRRAAAATRRGCRSTRGPRAAGRRGATRSRSLLAPVVVGAFGMLLELALRRTYGRDPLYGLLLTFGAALVLEEGIRAVFGSTEKQLRAARGDLRRVRRRRPHLLDVPAVRVRVRGGRDRRCCGCSSRRRRTARSSRPARTTARWCARSGINLARLRLLRVRARRRARGARRRRDGADLGHAPARRRRRRRAGVPDHRAGRRRQLLGRGGRRAAGRAGRRARPAPTRPSGRCCRCTCCSSPSSRSARAGSPARRACSMSDARLGSRQGRARRRRLRRHRRGDRAGARAPRRHRRRSPGATRPRPQALARDARGRRRDRAALAFDARDVASIRSRGASCRGAPRRASTSSSTALGTQKIEPLLEVTEEAFDRDPRRQPQGRDVPRAGGRAACRSPRSAAGATCTCCRCGRSSACATAATRRTAAARAASRCWSGSTRSSSRGTAST